MDIKVLRARATATDLGVLVSSADLLALLDMAEANAHAVAQPVVPLPEVDALAQAIRELDGSHQLGAGVLAEKLAEKLVDWLASQDRAPRATPHRLGWSSIRRSLALYMLGRLTSAGGEPTLAGIERHLDVLVSGGPLAALRECFPDDPAMSAALAQALRLEEEPLGAPFQPILHANRNTLYEV